MVDPMPCEVAAMEAAGKAGGEFIEADGRTDMAHWSEADWRSFIGAVCGAYVDALIAQQAELNTAVRKVQS